VEWARAMILPFRERRERAALSVTDESRYGSAVMGDSELALCTGVDVNMYGSRRKSGSNCNRAQVPSVARHAPIPALLA
jgi:hypothetical protein